MSGTIIPKAVYDQAVKENAPLVAHLGLRPSEPIPGPAVVVPLDKARARRLAPKMGPAALDKFGEFYNAGLVGEELPVDAPAALCRWQRFAFDPNQDGVAGDCVEVWLSRVYLVQVYRPASTDYRRRCVGPWPCIGIMRRDRRPITEVWDELQRVKNDVLGLEVTAVEVYPPESRIVNACPMRWLQVVPPGFDLPCVWLPGGGEDGAGAGGSR